MSRPLTGHPAGDQFEFVPCYDCGSDAAEHFVFAQDDLTGKPGTFRFVRCRQCHLVYQNPRLKSGFIGAYYDDEYIAHRKRTDWGAMTPLARWAMDKHDRDKLELVRRFVRLGPASRILDVGCGAGTFLAMAKSRTGASVVGVDFKDLSHLPAFEHVRFLPGLLHEQGLPRKSFDLVTMWHFLEHDYQPAETLREARELMAPEGRLVIEVPRLDSVSYRLFRDRWPGLQAPQHTMLFTRRTLARMVEKSGLEVVEYLPWGAFPAYFYLFAGTAFKLLGGRGLDLGKAIYPYFAGQLLLLPLLLFERRLNLAMQTVVCRRPGSP